MKILKVMTEHTVPFKILIEVLKELLPETNLEFISGDNDNDNENDNDNNNSDQDISKNISDNEKNSSDEEIDCIKNEKTESNTQKRKDGLKIMAVDTTKTVLIHLKLDAEEFTKFKCKKKRLVLGVNLVYFHKLIKTMDKDDNLTLYVDHDNLNYLKIKIDNPEEKKDSVFELKLLDLSEDKMSVPDITFDAVITMNSTEFHKICREMNQIADHVEIKCLNNKIIFTCKGDYAKRTTTYRTGDSTNQGDGVNIKFGKNKGTTPAIIQGIYELGNLVLFSKCASLCNEIEIFMKNNYPLVIKYTVATLGRILLCLTPIAEDSLKNANYSDEDEYYSDEEVKLIHN